MNCPNCSSDLVYRKNLTELTVWCDRCGKSFQAKQSTKPILTKQVYLSKGPRKGTSTVAVWYCPIDQTKYSFALSYGSGICAFNEFPDEPYLKGCYETPELALAAGIEEV